jgi:radical SAM superfamily enzyme YgiQ (UPF0313 family)
MSDERQRNLELLRKERALESIPAQSGDVRLALCYPNRYWVAMSNLGFQTIYKLFGLHPRLCVERVFYPEEDSSSIRSFEGNRTLREFELLAMSVSFETDYLYALEMLREAGLSLTRRDLSWEEREQEYQQRPFLLAGGAALTLNAEPLADFFDAIVIGEGEEIVAQISESFLAVRDRGATLKETLEELSGIEGLYIPAFYKPVFNSDDTLSHYDRLHDLAPGRVARRYLKNIDQSATYTVIQTPETEFKEMFMTETGRGCEVGCRFCVSGYMYRPTRKRSKETIDRSLQVGLENSASVGFVGASVSSHRSIAQLASEVAATGRRASLSSIMSQRVTKELAASLSESEYKTVALAPEAGSEELRFRIGKRVTNAQVLEAVELLTENGIRNIKLYCMVALPSEEERDVLAIVELAREAREAAHRGARKQSDFSVAPNIYLSVNPFIPKAWTPFQRHPFAEFGEVKRRIKLVEKGIARVPNLEMKFESPRESYFQALLSRGDRRVGRLMVEMLRLGKDWRWLVKNGSRRIVEDVPPADFYVHRLMGEEEFLPWELIDMHITRELLEREYRETFEEDVRPLIERKRRQLEARA